MRYYINYNPYIPSRNFNALTDFVKNSAKSLGKDIADVSDHGIRGAVKGGLYAGGASLLINLLRGKKPGRGTLWATIGGAALGGLGGAAKRELGNTARHLGDSFAGITGGPTSDDRKKSAEQIEAERKRGLTPEQLAEEKRQSDEQLAWIKRFHPEQFQHQDEKSENHSRSCISVYRGELMNFSKRYVVYVPSVNFELSDDVMKRIEAGEKINNLEYDPNSFEGDNMKLALMESGKRNKILADRKAFYEGGGRAGAFFRNKLNPLAKMAGKLADKASAKWGKDSKVGSALSSISKSLPGLGSAAGRYLRDNQGKLLGAGLKYGGSAMLAGLGTMAQNQFDERGQKVGLWKRLKGAAGNAAKAGGAAFLTGQLSKFMAPEAADALVNNAVYG